MYQKWPDQIFPIVNFVFSHNGHFGLGRGGGGFGGGVPPPLVFDYSKEALGGGGTPWVPGRQLLSTPSPGQQLVAKGTGLKSPWVPSVRDAPRARKAPERNCLSTLHPNTILEPHPDLNAHPTPKPTPTTTPTPTPTPNPRLGLEFVLGSKMKSNDVTNTAMKEILLPSASPPHRESTPNTKYTK